MESSTKLILKNAILKLVKSNEATSMNDIIEYLDYIHKVRYSKVEIKPLINELINDREIIVNNNNNFIRC